MIIRLCTQYNKVTFDVIKIKINKNIYILDIPFFFVIFSPVTFTFADFSMK